MLPHQIQFVTFSHLEAIVFVDHCLMGLSGIYTDDHERLTNPEALPALIKGD